MINKFTPENAADIKFRLLSVAYLLSKVADGLSIEELYDHAEGKFDILIGLINNEYSDDSLITQSGYSLDQLKHVSLSTFQQLISNPDTNPFMKLCVSEIASIDEVKRRRNKLLHVFHPDRNYGDISNGKMTVQINEAFEQILHNNLPDNTYKNSRTNIPPSYTHHYPHQKKTYEKKFYLLTVISVIILALIGLLKLISFF